MAAAVTVVVPAWSELKRTWLDAGGGCFSDEDYERIVAAHTANGDPAGSHTAQRVADGMWQIGRGLYICDQALSSTGTANHLYLLYPDGVMRSYGVIRASATMDAPTGNETSELSDADGAFTSSAVVTVGDIVVLSSGSIAKVVAVTATTLTTKSLSHEGVYAAGQAFYVVRASSNTDTTSTHTITGRPVDWRGAQRWIGERLLQQATTQRAAGMGGGSTTPPEVASIRQRLSELRGVRGR